MNSHSKNNTFVLLFSKWASCVFLLIFLTSCTKMSVEVVEPDPQPEVKSTTAKQVIKDMAAGCNLGKT